MCLEAEFCDQHLSPVERLVSTSEVECSLGRQPFFFVSDHTQKFKNMETDFFLRTDFEISVLKIMSEYIIALYQTAAERAS